jgi:hypothetical protein
MSANHVLLESIRLTQAAASVTFDNLPSSGYSDLKIVCSVRGTQAAESHALTLRFNSSTASYSSIELIGDGSGAGSATRTTIGSAMYLGNMNGNNTTANTFANAEIYIPNYLSSNPKSISVDHVSETNATTVYSTLLAGLWKPVTQAAITSIDLIALAAHGTFMAGSTFSLYGVAAYGTTPSVGPKASGGNIVTTDGTYWYHTFLSSGAFTPAASLSADYLVVAGGGAGGEGYSTRTGGGGAGGLRSTVGTTGGGAALESPASLISGTKYTITIGAGAVGGVGSNSSIAGTGLTTITSLGGGGGTQGTPGGNGGSGGGAGWNNPSQGFGGTGTAGQGYAGGNSSTGSPYAAGGGGGAGAAGQTTPNNSTGGNGGIGVAISAFASPTGTGVSNYYAGGGGGGGSSAGAGGSGGGGNGSSGTIGTAGTANTGGGGGGQLGEGYSAKGGSGIVIIRYAV